VAFAAREQPQIGLWAGQSESAFTTIPRRRFRHCCYRRERLELLIDIADQHGHKRDQFNGRIEIGGCLASV
jgi:hypothetical protein